MVHIPKYSDGGLKARYGEGRRNGKPGAAVVSNNTRQATGRRGRRTPGTYTHTSQRRRRNLKDGMVGWRGPRIVTVLVQQQAMLSGISLAGAGKDGGFGPDLNFSDEQRRVVCKAEDGGVQLPSTRIVPACRSASAAASGRFVDDVAGSRSRGKRASSSPSRCGKSGSGAMA